MIQLLFLSLAGSEEHGNIVLLDHFLQSSVLVWELAGWKPHKMS